MKLVSHIIVVALRPRQKMNPVYWSVAGSVFWMDGQIHQMSSVRRMDTEFDEQVILVSPHGSDFSHGNQFRGFYRDHFQSNFKNIRPILARLEVCLEVEFNIKESGG